MVQVVLRGVCAAAVRLGLPRNTAAAARVPSSLLSASHRTFLGARALSPLVSGLHTSAPRQKVVQGVVARAAGRAKKAASTQDADLDPEAAKKREALRKALDSINGDYGKGTVMLLGDSPQEKVATFSTGSIMLDLALGGGLPRGRIVEIYGPESSGKTSLAVHCMREMQRQGGTVALIDAEHAFNVDFAQKAGLNVRDLVFCQPDHGEQALDIVEKLMQHEAASLIVVDSVSSLVPLSEVQGEMGQAQMGSQARLMSSAMRRLAPVASKANCTIIFINQLRMKIGVMFGNPEITSGGNALKYYASVRMDIRRLSQPGEKGTAQPLGIRCKVKVVKNKVAPPYRQAEFDLTFASGINHLAGVVDAAKASGVLAGSGSWLSYNEQKWQGKEACLKALSENPALAKEVEDRVREAGATAVDPFSAEEDGEDYEGSEAAIEAEIEAAEMGGAR